MDSEKIKTLLYDINRTNDHSSIDELVKDYVWAEETRPIITEIKRLTMNEDDILVFKVTPKSLKSPGLRRFLDQIEKRISDRLGIDDPVIFMVSDLEDIELLDEYDMKLYGWEKI